MLRDAGHEILRSLLSLFIGFTALPRSLLYAESHLYGFPLRSVRSYSYAKYTGSFTVGGRMYKLEFVAKPRALVP